MHIVSDVMPFIRLNKTVFFHYFGQLYVKGKYCQSPFSGISTVIVTYFVDSLLNFTICCKNGRYPCMFYYLLLTNGQLKMPLEGEGVKA